MPSPLSSPLNAPDSLASSPEVEPLLPWWRHPFSYLLLTLFLLYVLAFIRNAWICDDAYITFRTVDNFIQGYGLRWNIQERVQTYTHPLWMFLLSLGYFYTREIYYTTLFFSFLCSLLAVFFLSTSLAKSHFHSLIVLLTLLFSRAFLDYSSSGLENPLSHLLLLLFFWIFVTQKPSLSSLFFLSFTASHLLLNRQDFLLLLAPALLSVFWTQRSWLALERMVFGFFPFLTWEGFSLVYYGFLVPNTAYAKLKTGIPFFELLHQGLSYFSDSLQNDPLTLITIVCALSVSLYDKKLRPVAFGLVLYGAYLLHIGGDFMSGRFFSAPFFLSLCILSQTSRLPQKRISRIVLALGIVALGSLTPHIPLLTNADFGTATQDFSIRNGIANERFIYYPFTGLLARLEKPPRVHPYVQEAEVYRKENQVTVKLHGSIGLRGFFSGPQVHLVDYYGITDPLLARLPAVYKAQWRIGHFFRHTPEGYLETLQTQTPSFKDPQTAAYYTLLQSATRAPLYSFERWIHIFLLHFVSPSLSQPFYRFPYIKETSLEELSVRKATGTPWNQKGNIGFAHEACLQIHFPKKQYIQSLEISVDASNNYKILFLQGEKILGNIFITTPPLGEILAVVQTPLPAYLYHSGFDTLRIFGAGKDFDNSQDSQYSIGHLFLFSN